MRVTVAPLALASLVILLGCTPADRFASDQTPLSPAPRSGSVDPTAPAQPSPEPYASPPPHPHPVSLPALIAKDLRGGDLAVGRVTLRTDAYTQHAVTYRSGGLTVSGLMNVPRGDGPWPALVLAHGYIDPQVYVSGQGLTRERDYLARHGFLTLHVDYRNHAGSSSDPTADRRLRLGYTEDVINAVHALRAGPSYVDDDRIGLLGRSMGGGVIYNVLVVAPGLVDAAAVFAPVSSDTVDNFERWIRRNPSRNGLAQQILTLYGEPSAQPAFWRAVSPRTYFDRVTEPVLIHHGTLDQSCPISWSRTTVAALERYDKDVRLFVYPGEGHEFGPLWPSSMKRTVDFFGEHLV